MASKNVIVSISCISVAVPCLGRGGIKQTSYVHHLLQHYLLQLCERGSGTDLVPQKSCKSGNERKSYEKRRGEATGGRWWNSH